MSTATWKIDKELAEIIMGDGVSTFFDLDRGWQWNWLLAKASQYEWAAFTPDDYTGYGDILCAKCAVKMVAEGKFDEIELFTYELSDIMGCDVCYEELGGWDCECRKCGKWELVTKGCMVVDAEKRMLFTTPQEYPGDDVEWLCGDCVEAAIDKYVTSADPDHLDSSGFAIKEGFSLESEEGATS